MSQAFVISEYIHTFSDLAKPHFNQLQLGALDELLAEIGERETCNFDEVKKLLDLVFETNQTEQLAFAFGASLLPSSHGFLGYAIKSAKNLEECLNITTNYMSVRTTFFEVKLLKEEKLARLVFHCNIPEGKYSNFILISLLMAFGQVGNEMFTSQSLENSGSLNLKFRNQNSTLFSKITSPNTNYDQLENAVEFDKKLLKSQPITRDDSLHLLALEQVKQNSEKYSDPPLLSTVKSFIKRDYGLQNNLGDLSIEMCISPRTLKRRLKEQNISYKEVLKNMRKDRACYLLTSTELTIDQIAESVGYVDTSNFCRSFRSWCGLSPKQYRTKNK